LPPPALFEDTSADKKRKHVDEFTSSSTSVQRTTANEAPVLKEDVEFFDLMASYVLCKFYDFTVLAFFLSGCITSVSSCSDDEELKKDVAATPSTQDAIANEPSVQETEPAVQALRATRASTKKITAFRSTKRSKKSQEAEVSLEAHEPTGSSDNVSGCTVLYLSCAFHTLTCFSLVRH
jgi:hypothetical protein